MLRSQLGSALPLALALAACGGGDDWHPRSLDSALGGEPAAIAPTARVRFAPLLSLAVDDLADVGLGADGRVYVLEPKARAIAVLAPDGRATHRISLTDGVAAGAIVRPRELAVLAGAVAVYDDRAHRVSVYDSLGRLARVLVTPTKGKVTIRRGAAAHQLVLYAPADSAAPLRVYDIGTDRPPHAAAAPPVGRAAAEVCAHDGGFRLANPWQLEVADLDVTGRVIAVTRHRAPAFAPVTQRRDTTPGATLLGLLCGDRGLTVLGYIDRLAPVTTYAVYDARGALLDTLAYHAGTAAQPGFPRDFRGDRLATFATKPAKRVHVYRVTVGGRS